MGLLNIEKITKIYRKGFKAVRVTAVRDVSFALAPDRITGFVGPNGAGKTTTIKMVMGLVRPTRGRITLFGRDAADPASRRGVAYVSEQPYFYKHLSVGETVEFAARLTGIKPADLTAECKRVLSEVELTGRESSKVRSLSKGLQQRLNMACGLLGDPKLLIFDEPMSGLDPPSRRLFRELFKKLGDEGRTIFFSTHVLEDIEAVCQDVVVLDGGELRFTGSVSSLLEKGTLGTEFIVKSLPDDIANDLRGEGLDISRTADGNIVIFISADKDQSLYQRKLYGNGILCDTIQKRTMPLESLLYGNNIKTMGDDHHPDYGTTASRRGGRPRPPAVDGSSANGGIS